MFALRKTTFPAVLSTFLVCFAFWLLLTFKVSTQELIAGAVVSVLAALFAGRFFVHEKAGWFFNPAKFFTGLCYWIFVFPGELIKANCSMAGIVLGGCKKVKPGIVKIPVDLKSDYGQAALANSITLTPGTITMETTEEDGQNYLYVHWIDVTETDPEKAGEAIKGRMERALRRVWQ